MALASCGMLAAFVTASPAAQTYADCFLQSNPAASTCPGRLLFDLDGAVMPDRLPKRELAPVALEVRSEISNEGGTHPPALREAAIDFDKNVAIEARGLPVCTLRQLKTRRTDSARHLCRDAIVGSGVAHIGIDAPKQAPTRVSLTLFNGGVQDGVTRLFIHGTIATLKPIPIVVTVRITKAQKGRYGWQSISRIPPILDGSGSLLDFRLKIERHFEYKGTERHYLMARCFDGRLQAGLVKAVFRRDEPRTTTVLSGTVVHPCTPLG